MNLVLGLVGGISTYFVSSLGGIAIVKFLNYRLCFRSWILFALLSRSTWLLSCPLHWCLQRREHVSLGVTNKQLRLYFLIAIGLSVVELLNASSMSILPGSWYALLKGSDVGFSMALSRIILGKKYHIGQVVGAGFVMGGIGLVFVLKSEPTTESESASAGATISLTTASMLCLCAACLNALCAVLTEATLKETLKEEQDRLLERSSPEAHVAPSKLLLSNAYSMWTTFFSFVLLALPAFLSGQVTQAFRGIGHTTTACSDNGGGLRVENLSALLLAMLLLLGVSRFSERLSKHWICVSDSAVTFSLVQAARRLSGVFILAALFQELFPSSMIIGSFLSGVGFAMHFWYGRAAAVIDPGQTDRKASTHEYELVATNPRTDEPTN